MNTEQIDQTDSHDGVQQAAEAPASWTPRGGDAQVPSPVRAGRRRKGDQTATRTKPALAAYAFVRSAILTLAALLGVVSVAVFVGSYLMDVRPLIVASGSMEPTIPVGSVVFSQAVDASVPQPGDIVTVQRPRNLGLITHRLVSSTEAEPGVFHFVLRGDANAIDDPEPYVVQTVGLYKFHVNWLGYVAHYLQIGTGQIVGLAIALFVVAIFILDPARVGSRARGESAGDGGPRRRHAASRRAVRRSGQ